MSQIKAFLWYLYYTIIGVLVRKMIIILLLAGSLYDAGFKANPRGGNVRSIHFKNRKKIDLLPTLSGNERIVSFVPQPDKSQADSFRRTGVDAANIPYYVNSLNEIEIAIKNLDDNLLSMSGAIPTLMDPRREIAEIISVVFGIAKKVANTCVPTDYEQSYDKLVDEFSPRGIAEPEDILSDLESGIESFKSETGSLTTLIKNKCLDRSNPRVCDLAIHQIVSSQPAIFEKEAKVLFLAYNAAYEYNQVANEFSAAANIHQGHKLIIEYPQKFKGLIYAFANLIYTMTPSLSRC